LPQTYLAPQKTPRKAAGPESEAAPPAPRSNGRGAPQASGAPFAPAVAPEPVLEAPSGPVNEAGDDRDTLQPGVPLLLIVENDLSFAKLLLDVAHEKGFQALATS